MVKKNTVEEKELNNITPRILKSICCKSYQTTRGRCYSCPKDDQKKSDED